MNRNARLSSVSILDRIVATKRAEVAVLLSVAGELRAQAEAAPRGPEFAAALAGGANVAVIAEVKRRSPSAGEIRGRADAADVASAYEEAGAAAISVLTDRDYFGGALADLRSAATRVRVPLLRKDFTVHEVQVYEARAVGAAAVLLIVRILADAELRSLRELAEALGMAALVEVHDERELERALLSGARIVGINNRDLATFTTDLAVTEQLAARVPGDVTLVAESGISSRADVERVALVGAAAVLVGESLMRAPDARVLLRELAGVRRRGARA